MEFETAENAEDTVVSAFAASRGSAFSRVANHIHMKFHVRLTDDGWEWVEEGE